MSGKLPKLTKQQQGLAVDVVSRLIFQCQSHNIDFMKLDKNTKSLLISIWQDGLQYARSILFEIGEQKGSEQ